jgi:hypothetical protein
MSQNPELAEQLGSAFGGAGQAEETQEDGEKKDDTDPSPHYYS